ncbi:hypothetical protein Ctob_013278 [Chrysochromulina tobinii]|uniref:Uncharacterized protein n=1 Tax=Chrysochromulina tobinii TaxID=1460289 RepID=A0A0M0K567_9EUKA|nr:hypothetical protein Ctob_013278 [Chrysochromulina tobinii]|eukprot:KOO33528.1 hypothetical protein Ctob_013278 [Chrysochromulina sp. CCMP291]
MSLYRALVMLGISVVHYSRTYNATTGRESTTYGQIPPDAQAAAALALWHRVVSASVAPDRLLVLDLFHTPSDELWRQLCNFLDQPLPVAKDGLSLPPFPHERYGDDVRRFVADVQGGVEWS